ncbi:MAG: hypothetical protein WAM14_26860, partial [Candidatus Nitrosopolaris sp.]
MYAQTPPVNSTYIMIGNSMSPNIHDNDGMVVDSQFPFDSFSFLINSDWDQKLSNIDTYERTV